MIGRKELAACLVATCMVGCSSVQVRYEEKGPRRSVVSDYTVIKKTKKSWYNTLYRSFPIYRIVAAEDIKKFGVTKTVIGYCIFLVPPAVDLAILPFQALYDTLFSYRTEYEEHLTVSGTLLDEQGAPLPHAHINIAGADKLTDEQGRIHATFDYAGRYEPSGQIYLKMEMDDRNAISAGYQRGDARTLTLPLQVRYSVHASPNGSAVVREDFFVRESTAAGRDEIKTGWEPVSLTGDTIRVRRRDLFSKKNQEITLKEFAAALVMRIQDELLQLRLFDEHDIFSATRDYETRPVASLAAKKQDGWTKPQPRIFHLPDPLSVLSSTAPVPIPVPVPDR